MCPRQSIKIPDVSGVFKNNCVPVIDNCDICELALAPGPTKQSGQTGDQIGMVYTSVYTTQAVRLAFCSSVSPLSQSTTGL